MKEKNNIAFMMMICLISIFIMIATLNFTKENTDSISFTPPPFDQETIKGIPDVPEKLGWTEIDTKAYKVSICGEIFVEDGKADVWFFNPESNTVWLKLRVLDATGDIIGETGIIRPGEYLQKIHFNITPDAGDSIGLKFMGYEPDTYYSAGSVTVNTTVIGGK